MPGSYTVTATAGTSSAYIDVVVLDVSIDTPTSFPAYWAIDTTPLQLECTPKGATGGTYSWSKVSGPGNVTFSSSTAQNPTFIAHQPGIYFVRVEYTLGGCTVSKTAGGITVHQVDMFPPSANYTIGAGNVNIYYNIYPTGVGFTADTAILEIRDKDGTLVYSDNTITKIAGGNTATWSGSSTSLRTVHWNKNPYEAKITITKGSTNSADTMSINFYQSTASVVAETSSATGVPLTECMEGRTVTFTATASGFVSTSPLNPIDFTFWGRLADGTWNSNTDWSYDLIHDHDAIADDVLDGDSDHYFDTPVYVDVEDNFGHFITTSSYWVRVWELYIEYFRDNASGTAKPWKVVVGKDIAYSATASPDCTNWCWDMAEGIPDQWNPTGGNAKSGTAMVIPNSDLPSDSHWDHFGTAYGQVKVFCEDEEGNNHTFYSTSMNPSQKASVFFDPTVATHPGGGSDNWFYYWKYALFGSVSNVSWNAATAYGSTNLGTGAIVIGESGNNDYATAYNHFPLFGYARPTADGKSYIDLFYSVLKHELQHRADGPYFGGVPDADGDNLPDARDPFPGTLNGAGYTEYTGANAWLGDWECSARNVEGVVAPAASDWSEGGKQW